MELPASCKLLRLSEVSKLTSLGKSTINLWVAQGRFPRPTMLSKTIKVWRVADVEQWVASIPTLVSGPHSCDEVDHPHASSLNDGA